MKLKQWLFKPEGDGGGAGGSGDGGASGGGSGNAGGAGGDWRASLPAELRDAPALKDTKDLGGLAKQFVDLQSHLGNSIRIPGADAGPDAVKEFHGKLVSRVPGLYYLPKDDDAAGIDALYTKLGTPKDIAAYEIPVPEGAQELPGFREWALEAKLTKSQAKILASKWNESFGKDVAAQQKRLAEDSRILDAEWGAAKPEKLQGIINFAEQTGAPKELVELAKAGQLGANTMRWISKVVDLVGTESTGAGGDNGAPRKSTPHEANMQIHEIMARKEYWDPNSPIQKDLITKVVELGKMASPGAATEMERVGYSG